MSSLLLCTIKARRMFLLWWHQSLNASAFFPSFGMKLGEKQLASHVSFLCLTARTHALGRSLCVSECFHPTDSFHCDTICSSCVVYSVQPRVRLAARFTAFNVGDTYAYAYVQAPPLDCLTFCRVLCDLRRILDMPLLAERSHR